MLIKDKASECALYRIVPVSFLGLKLVILYLQKQDYIYVSVKDNHRLLTEYCRNEHYFIFL